MNFWGRIRAADVKFGDSRCQCDTYYSSSRVSHVCIDPRAEGLFSACPKTTLDWHFSDWFCRRSNPCPIELQSSIPVSGNKRGVCATGNRTISGRYRPSSLEGEFPKLDIRGIQFFPECEARHARKDQYRLAIGRAGSRRVVGLLSETRGIFWSRTA